ncbi:MAG: aminotransferase class V-fold PLP-dependent enzyme [Gammaproteobacteria bacterium]|nr:aminotransferase class V-fold PLP-dependent enzyme [Gammaproteobacteria bacterium]
MLAEWPLDPGVLYLNHGTVGATPRRVLARQQAIRDEMERQPARFVLRECSGLAGLPRDTPSLMRQAADRVAAFCGCDGDDLVFVDNATAGVNAVLQSLDLHAGDEILLGDHTYGAVTKAACFHAARAGARVVTVTVPYPRFDRAQFLDTVSSALGPRTRLAIFDHVTSESALVLPLAELAALCRAHGVPVLADGAHAPGAIPLEIRSLGVDWYTGNLHKWAWAPRSCGILWAARDRQPTLHPVVISWGLGEGFTREFDWVGTRDPSPWLAAPAGIDFMEELGVDAVRGWNHRLARDAAQLLGERWGTICEAGPETMGTMATIPLPPDCGSIPGDAARLRDRLLYEASIEVQLHAWGGRLWVRVSAQIYNEISDFERLAAAVTSGRPGTAIRS